MESRSQRGRRQVLSTYATTFFVLLSRVLVYKWSPELFDEKDFALYILGLRGLSLGYVAMGPALVAGLSYYVARVNSDSEDHDGPYLLASYLLALAFFVPLLAAAVLAPAVCAKLLLGASQHAPLMLPLAVALVGQYLAVIALSFLLGKTKVHLANLIGVASGVLVPVLCLWAYHDSAQQVFWAMAWATLALGLGSNLLLLVLGVENLRLAGEAFKAHLWRFCGYSLPRMPAAAGVAFLLAQPMIIPTHKTEVLTVAAIFAAGGTLIGMASSLIQPLALVLLPHAAQMLAQGQREEVRIKSITMLKGLTVATLAGTVLMALLTGTILELWLGPEARQYAYFWLGLLPGMLPIALYRAFSSVLNAAHHKPYDSQNVGLSVLAFGLAFVALGSLGWETQLLVSFNLALYLLATLTVTRTLSLLKSSL